MTDFTLTNPPKSDCAYAYECLRQDIMSGRIQPHERIVETSYAEKLGISRTPIREALRLLERDGLVDFQPKRGATARECLTAEEIREVFRLRTLLQLDSAKASVENITRGELSAMAGCNGACASAIDEEDSEAFFRYYNRFNEILLRSSKKTFSVKLLEYLENFVPIASELEGTGERPDVQKRMDSLDTWKVRRKALREHMAIWDALNNRDVTAYIRALKRHIDNRDDGDSVN